MKYIIKILVLLLPLLYQCCENGHLKKIAAGHPEISYQGRVDSSAHSHIKIFWPGTAVIIHFRGKILKVALSDTRGDTYYNVIVDGEKHKIIRPGKKRSIYKLAEFDGGTHKVQLFRRSGYTSGTTRVFSFLSDKKAQLMPVKPQTKQIVFYGNSITTGYANEDTSGSDRPDSIFTNNYMSYAALTSRHFNADYHCIARGGIGFMVSWYPLIMPELYNRLNPHQPEKHWNFPDDKKLIVVINLGQNDSWILQNPKMDEYKYRFQNRKIDKSEIITHYTSFVQKIRNHHPKAAVICCLGSMDAVAPDSPWPRYIQKAVKEMNDPNIHTFFFPWLAKHGHPRVKDHKIMAAHLIRFIDQNNLWHAEPY